MKRWNSDIRLEVLEEIKKDKHRYKIVTEDCEIFETDCIRTFIKLVSRFNRCNKAFSTNKPDYNCKSHI